jgi:hypothetical protein
MKVVIAYPQIRKGDMSSTIEISDGTNLSEVQDKILESFWEVFLKNFLPSIGKHGSREDVVLKDKDIVISNDEILKERLKTCTSFQASFKEHVLTHASKA